MNLNYRPKTTEQALGYLVEECGEVLQAVGKSQRWGSRQRQPGDQGPCFAGNEQRLDPARVA